MKRSKKTTSYVIFAIILTFAIGVLFITPAIGNKLKENKREEVLDNLKNIYTSAIIVDEIDVGLHEDVDKDGKHIKLSEMSGFRVYNSKQDKKYSVQKDYKSNKITVYYGKDIQYPEKHEEREEIDEGNITNEDLFTYDESSGKVVLTGFSEEGVKLLESGSVIQIPTTYKGRDVVEIAEKAFYNKNIMGTVIIPENIKSIGKHAFSNNGVKGVSNNITKPYQGSWKVEEKTWKKKEK